MNRQLFQKIAWNLETHDAQKVRDGLSVLIDAALAEKRKQESGELSKLIELLNTQKEIIVNRIYHRRV